MHLSIENFVQVQVSHDATVNGACTTDRRHRAVFDTFLAVWVVSLFRREQAARVFSLLHSSLGILESWTHGLQKHVSVPYSFTEVRYDTKEPEVGGKDESCRSVQTGNLSM